MLTSTQIRNQAVRRRAHMGETRTTKNVRGWKSQPKPEATYKQYDLRYLRIPQRLGRIVEGTSFCMR
jgi:hypothetical protein